MVIGDGHHLNQMDGKDDGWRGNMYTLMMDEMKTYAIVMFVLGVIVGLLF